MKPGDLVWFWTRQAGDKHARRQWGTLVYLGEKYAFVDLPGPRPVQRVTVNRKRLQLVSDAPENLRRLTSS